MDREVFCCGPEVYMDAVRSMLKEAGYDMSRYHEESFGATPVKDVERAEKHADEAEIQEQQPKDLARVYFKERDLTASVAVGVNLNEAAAEAGVNISKACGVGICGACKVKVLSGDAKMEHNGGITEDDIAEGYVLSCCTTVQGDIEIEY